MSRSVSESILILHRSAKNCLIKPTDVESLWTLFLLKLTATCGTSREPYEISSYDGKSYDGDFQQLLTRRWVLRSLPHVPGHVLLESDGQFRKQAQNRHKCPMEAIEVEANTKIRKNLTGRSRPMTSDYAPRDAVCNKRAGKRVHQSQGHWM